MSEILKLKVTCSNDVSFVTQQYKMPLIRSMVLTNNGTTPLTDLDLEICSKPEELCMPCKHHIDLVPAGGSVDLKNVKLLLNPEYLAKLSEKLTATLEFVLTKGEEELLTECEQVTVLAFDECTSYRELLPAFVTPNEKNYVPTILKRASELLGVWTGKDSLDSYLPKDPNRVRKCAAAIYTAIRECGIAYATLAASFEPTGQRVRLIHTIMNGKLANCMDFTLFLASCLEAADLNPLLILVPGHIYCGVWLVEKTFPEIIVKDAGELVNRLENKELVLIESTLMRVGDGCDFDGAVRSAEHQLRTNGIDHVVDVGRARQSGVTPLPTVQETEGGLLELVLDGNSEISTDNPDDLEEFENDSKPLSYDKLLRWEANLLNTKLTNPLLNQRYGGDRNIPVFADNLQQLLDAVAEGDAYVFHCVDDEELKAKDFNTLAMAKNKELFTSELSNNRLRTPMGEKELPKALKSIYRQYQNSLNEMGSNTLFLSVGQVCWHDAKNPDKPLYAPLLLVPLNVEYKSNTYRFRMGDGEIMLNATLMEKVRQDYRLNMPTWDSLPVKKNGSVDIGKVISAVRKSFADMPGWGVLECAVVSHYNFAQYAMWRDIHENHELLQRSPLVNSLLLGKLTWNPDYETFRNGLPEGTMVIPVTTDASQMFAIEQACNGKSFVLHGPPGTGKSQCITAMIAYAMAHGLRVLFVAGKKTALEVPYTRLQDIGLDTFCLELHSNKTNAEKVMGTYNRLLDMANAPTENVKLMEHNYATREYSAKLSEVSQLRRELDDYSKALHTDRPCGMTLHTLVNHYAACGDGVDFPRERLMPAGEMTTENLAKQSRKLTELAMMRQTLGNPAEHPLRMVGSTEFSQQHSSDMRRSLTEYRNAITGLKDAAVNMAMTYHLAQPEDYGDYRQMSSIAGNLERWNSMPRQWIASPNLKATLGSLEKLAADRQELNDLEWKLRGSWKPSFLKRDGLALAEEYNRCCSRNGFFAGVAMRQLARDLASDHIYGTVLTAGQLGDQLALLCDYQAKSENFEDDRQAMSGMLRACFGDENDGLDKVPQAVAEASKLADVLDGVATADHVPLRSHYADNGFNPGTHRKLLSALDQLKEKRDNFHKVLGIAEEGRDYNDLDAEVAMCDRMLQDLGSLRNWTEWNRQCQSAKEMGLDAAVEAFASGEEPERILEGYRKSSYQALIEDIIDNDPTLSNFVGIKFNLQIEMFRQLDESLTHMSREQICQILTDQVVDVVQEASQCDNSLSMLNKTMGKSVSLRKLFAQHADLLLKLTPCVMMSPQSVAQYLPMKEDMFDLVIFDEASQLTTSSAIGALARGKAAVIVGDNCQMPPTSFFDSVSRDEENLEIEDMESILDDCLALEMPQTHLRWHYRSNHDSLINFSNHYFYGNKLFTFPSATDRNSHVHLKQVTDGVYDAGKTRCNIPEAEAVIEHLREMSQDEAYQGKSVAIITSNIHQQNLIDDMLQEACKSDNQLCVWLRDAHEPILIQNLENIQGHERDVVIYSVGYGPDAQGKVSMHFGPLNRENGWRRLNVAITRARDEMVVFSSLLPEQINGTSRGVVTLRRFLEYAGGKALPAQNHTNKTMNTPNGVAESIVQALEDAGYKVDRNLGHSDLRVDLAIIDPDHPDQYLMGVLLDGIAYGAAKTTRDRELSHGDVLTGLGWKLHRIWVMDWWDDRNGDEQIRTLLKKLNALCGTDAT